MWLSPLFPLSRSARWSSCSILPGVPRALAVSSAGSFPLYPLHSLVCINGLDVVGSSNIPANDTPSFIPHNRLACVGLELLLHGRERVVRASSAPILSAELLVHGTKSSPCCSPSCPSCVCRSQWSASAGLCTFASGARRPLFSVFRGMHSKVSDRNPKGMDPVAEPCSEFHCALVLLEAGFAIHCIASCSGFGPTGFFPISLPHVSHASVGRLENGVSPQGPRTFCASTSLTFLCF